MDLGPPIQTHFSISLTMSYLVEAQGNQRRSRINIGFGLIVSEPDVMWQTLYVLSAYFRPDSELSLRVQHDQTYVRQYLTDTLVFNNLSLHSLCESQVPFIAFSIELRRYVESQGIFYSILIASLQVAFLSILWSQALPFHSIHL